MLSEKCVELIRSRSTFGVNLGPEHMVLDVWLMLPPAQFALLVV